MISTRRALDRTIGVGGPSFAPRFRPRRLVMPVDPAQRSNAEQRSADPVFTQYLAHRHLQRLAARKGTVKLGTVPHERTVGDAFRLVLHGCHGRGFLVDGQADDPAAAPLRAPLWVADAAGAGAAAAPDGTAETADGVAVEIHGGDGARSCGGRAHGIWEMLDRTPLDSPVHGALALRGGALAERTIAADLCRRFPRLRDAHVHSVVHTTTGLLPVCRAAISVGLVHTAGVETDVGLWREMNYLRARHQWAAARLAAARERARTGLATDGHAQPHREWLYRRQARTCSRLLSSFPVGCAEELRARVQWTRDQFFALVAAVAETYGPAVAQNLVRRLLALDVCLPRLAARLEADAHPLEHRRADRRALRQATSTAQYGSEAPPDEDVAEDAARPGAAGVPPVVLRALQPSNAVKEAQLIFKYAPTSPHHIRNGAVDFDVREQHDDPEETVNYNFRSTAQNFHSARKITTEMVAGCGDRWDVVGVGAGPTLQQAMQRAATHAVQNYYTR